LYHYSIIKIESANSSKNALRQKPIIKQKQLKFKGIFSPALGVAVSDPRLTYPAVPAAVNKALEKAGLTLSDIDLIEIQEAFEAQVPAVKK